MAERTIPLISEERLAELVASIKPVAREEYDPLAPFHEVDFVMEKPSTFREIEPVDPVRQAFTWGPKPVGDPLDLEFLGEEETYHNWGFYGFFKPSLQEVFACLDGKIPEGTTHFWLDKNSVQVPGEPLLHKPDEHNISGYHKARVYLFRQR